MKQEDYKKKHINVELEVSKYILLLAFCLFPCISLLLFFYNTLGPQRALDFGKPLLLPKAIRLC